MTRPYQTGLKRGGFTSICKSQGVVKENVRTLQLLNSNSKCLDFDLSLYAV